MASIQRIFLDWSRPALHTVADQLIARSRSPHLVDLSHLVLVFYGSQAGRRCLELLTERAGGKLCPPRIVTVGQLPELLYEPKRPFASVLVQQLVWAQALRNTPPARLRSFVSAPPEPADQAGWLRLGELLRKQHEELARDQLDFSDVWRRGASLAGFDEVDRWKLLADIQREYWNLLDSFDLWDQQTARLEAIKRKECGTDFEIVTVGTVDLNRTMRSMLDQIADQVTAYVPAPEELSGLFDAYGCLIPDRWVDRTVSLKSDQVLMADDAASQCATVLSILTGFDGRYSLDEITIGVPDPQLVVPLQRTLDEYGVKSHWPVDRDLSATGPHRLLEAVAEFLEDDSASRFAALLRHPDLSAWLDTKGLPSNWLNCWDAYFTEHLPRKLDWVLEGHGAGVVLQLKRTVSELLEPLQRTATLANWSEPIETLLRTLYEERMFDPDDPDDHRTLEACRILSAAFSGHQGVPAVLDSPLSAPEAIRLTLKNAACELYRGETDAAIQLVGWLEMPLDDAPAAIVTTFNETFVPKSVNHDLFLPNRLRSHLGIEDNTRRYARDLFLLTTLVHAREELRLIVARRDASHDPLTPSRLLFATDPEEIAKRVLAFYDPQESVPLVLPTSPRKIAAESAFPIPQPMPREAPPTVFRVTEFRDYLASPYRYYLRHVLKLENVSDDLDELDGAAFGNLVHEVLKRFGRSERSRSTDSAVIADFLQQELKNVVAEVYGDEPLAAVLIQSEQARRRLNAFSLWQANWRREGWQIYAVEHATDEPVPFSLHGGRKIFLKGRIDRIDYHADTDTWCIFDYKTGDSGLSPAKTHRDKSGWIDLQLPLYRHLAASICKEDEVRLGYIVLPRDSKAVAAQFAEWSWEDLQEADETARRVAKEILAEEFWKPLSAPAGTLTEFDSICQVGVFGQEVML
ncbi:PD-(D/E)XK nuclease family protein [Planctomicrobium sp. SH661]|uniref:PD-(D/E)XK nuclease family protein n=1 Tax=Planctomicrobium sp. SH661 TaxID=3448124 RepID=UPI003F5B7BAC